MDKCKECGSENIGIMQSDTLLYGCPECLSSDAAENHKKCPVCGYEELSFGYDATYWYYCGDCDASGALNVGAWISA